MFAPYISQPLPGQGWEMLAKSFHIVQQRLGTGRIDVSE
jgi:hypothetical protein